MTSIGAGRTAAVPGRSNGVRGAGLLINLVRVNGWPVTVPVTVLVTTATVPRATATSVVAAAKLSTPSR